MYSHNEPKNQSRDTAPWTNIPTPSEPQTAHPAEAVESNESGPT